MSSLSQAINPGSQAPLIRVSRKLVVGCVALCFALPVTSVMAQSQYSTKAVAKITSCTTAAVSGFATLKERASDEGIKEVEVFIQMQGLGDSQRAVHLHEFGSCTPCGSAGGHFDPGNFGFSNPDANHPFHSGDLPQITSRGNTAVSANVTSRVTLSEGRLSLLDSDGSAFIVHDNPDSYCAFGEAAGCAGGSRAACGIITPVVLSDNFELLVSSDRYRRGSAELSNNTLNNYVYIFLTPLYPNESVTSVNFFINGRPAKTETRAPYDLSGTRYYGSAGSYDTRNLEDGENTISAVINLSGGEQTFVSSVFNVDNNSLGFSVRRRHSH
ncbi:MAG: superoxide dismutase family protein [Granulosicoccus sp.]